MSCSCSLSLLAASCSDGICHINPSEFWFAISVIPIAGGGALIDFGYGDYGRGAREIHPVSVDVGAMFFIVRMVTVIQLWAYSWITPLRRSRRRTVDAERGQQVVEQWHRGVRVNGGALAEGFFPPGLKGRPQILAHPRRGMGVQAAHPGNLMS